MDSLLCSFIIQYVQQVSWTSLTNEPLGLRFMWRHCTLPTSVIWYTHTKHL